MRGRLEASMLYFPSRAAPVAPPGAEEVRFRTTDGLELHGWFLPPTSSTAPPPYPTVIHAHGNAGNIENHLAFSEFLRGHGFAVLLFDYRSFGRSDLSPRHLRREDLVADTHAAIDYALTRADVDPERVALYGFSLGGVIALGAAIDRPGIRAVVSVAAFSSWKGIASDHMGIVGRWCMRPGLDAAASAACLGERPLLIVHGEQDRIVPVAHARAIAAAADAAGVPVEVIVVPDGHNDIVIDDTATQGRIATFLRRALGMTPTP